MKSWNCRENKRGRRGEVKTEKELQQCQSRGAERRNGSFITLTHRQPGEEEEVVEVLPWWCRACWDVGAGAGQK